MEEKRLNFSNYMPGIFFILAIILFALFTPKEAKAASSYTNAREFFYSTNSEKNGSFHMDIKDGNVYYATRAKTAAETSSLRYRTIGFDIVLEGGGQSVSFSLKRNWGDGDGSLELVDEDNNADGYSYLLYCVPKDTLTTIGDIVNSSAMATIKSSDFMYIHMWGILTTNKGNASCSENGAGGLSFNGSPVWHMNNASDINSAKSMFSGHTFSDYIDLNKPISNPLYSIVYNANSGSVSNGYKTTSSGMIQLNGSNVTTTRHLYEDATLLDANAVGLSKTGYHLQEGKEWLKYGTSTAYKSNETYSTNALMPGGIVSQVTMYAYWQPNTYTIVYDANGGTGSMKSSTYTYDVEGKLSKNTYKRTGYTFCGWSYAKNGEGIIKKDEATVKNWTTIDNDTITLYAIWKPSVYTITTKTMSELLETNENTTISKGTTEFYELFSEYYGYKYDKDADTIANYLATYDPLTKTSSGFSAISDKTSSIASPTITGYNFLGYYKGVYSSGDKIVAGATDKDNENGLLLQNASYFTQNSTIYANWEPKTFTITFDKQGGSGGTDTAIATYGKDLPYAEAPSRTGYSFKGYYTEKNGNGTCYYDENMSGQLKYMLERDLTLYAHWVDDIAPTVTAVATPDTWSNGIRGYGTGIDVIITAYDKGTG